MKRKALKLVVVGDCSCGKTSLIVAQASGAFGEQYTPTAFDDFVVEALVNGKTEMLVVCDTAGSEDFSSLRPLSYPDADVFIICYSVDQIDSLRSIREKWIPEVKHFCPNTPIIIVGNKKDIRPTSLPSSPNGSPIMDCIDIAEAESLAKEYSNFQVIECSAKQKENVRTVFEAAIRAAIAYRNRRKNKVIQQLMKLRLVF
ncbi:ras family domain-containing protein [Ditylenchus destructor]|nr:ras family domain-containing protein [Ditylenchus destructor]